MASAVSQAIAVLVNQLKAQANGGAAVNLSALNFGTGGVYYWRGTTSGAYKYFATAQLWQRFYEELWETPTKNLIGTTSTGVVYVLPTGVEANGENNINNVQRYSRSIAIDVVAVWLDEGAFSDYEQIVDALIKDALQDPTLGGYITFFRFVSCERLHPRGVGLAGCKVSFTMDYSISVP